MFYNTIQHNTILTIEHKQTMTEKKKKNITETTLQFNRVSLDELLP